MRGAIGAQRRNNNVRRLVDEDGGEEQNGAEGANGESDDPAVEDAGELCSGQGSRWDGWTPRR